MAVGEVMRMEIPAGGDLTVTTPELHVLAVDDSIVDRKVIERLLRISSCKVTTVESGTRALQYLGLDGGKGASNLKVIKNKSSLFCYLLRRTLVYLGKTEGVKPLQLWLWLLLLLVFMIK
jgi:hypothetical protein